MRLRLKRLGEEDESTLGLLLGPGSVVMPTIEPPWRDNRPFHSCVPAGFYTLEEHTSQQHGQTWALVGETVSHYAQFDVLRNLCLFHAANWASELQGCIAPGTGFARMDSKIAVTESARAMGALRDLLRRDGRHYLTIEGDSR
jgi:hypothetical protein